MHRFASVRCGDWLHAKFRPDSISRRWLPSLVSAHEKSSPGEKLQSWLDHCAQKPRWAGSHRSDRRCRLEFGEYRYESFIGSKWIAQGDLAIQLNAASSEANMTNRQLTANSQAGDPRAPRAALLKAVSIATRPSALMLHRHCGGRRQPTPRRGSGPDRTAGRGRHRHADRSANSAAPPAYTQRPTATSGCRTSQRAQYDLRVRRAGYEDLTQNGIAIDQPSGRDAAHDEYRG